MSNITISSKNQLTIPKSFIELLALGEGRTLAITIQNGSLVLTPQPSLNETMRQFWGKNQSTQSFSDDELRQATRDVAARKAA